MQPAPSLIPPMIYCPDPWHSSVLSSQSIPTGLHPPEIAVPWTRHIHSLLCQGLWHLLTINFVEWPQLQEWEKVEWGKSWSMFFTSCFQPLSYPPIPDFFLSVSASFSLKNQTQISLPPSTCKSSESLSNSLWRNIIISFWVIPLWTLQLIGKILTFKGQNSTISNHTTPVFFFKRMGIQYIYGKFHWEDSEHQCFGEGAGSEASTARII